MEREGEGIPAKESILVTVLDKVDGACTWVKEKGKSVCRFFSGAFRGLRSFFTFSSEKPEEVLSGSNTQIDNSSEKKPMVQVAPEEGEKVEVVVDQDASVPAKDSFFVRVWNKMHEAWTWVKDKVKSVSKLFITESITEALLGIRSFVTEVLSGINTQLDNLSGKPRKVGEVPEEGGLLDEMNRLLQKMRKLVDQWLGVGNSLGMKAARLTVNWLLDLVGGFIELLQKAIKVGGVMRDVRCKQGRKCRESPKYRVSAGNEPTAGASLPLDI
ncbi:uncharacterized protein LOC117913764 [Vitis riparia]|uniref:uncharacterized protein LOC117913764 n=1 Tax=Vitis riparia TaxID=96939 RepID=UPI00155A7696|nr:uncharacterized protein LOC117913764 [Vitis riparia]